MSSHRLRANRTDCFACSSTCSGVMRSFFSMCSGDVAMKVWMRARWAPLSASAAREMSRSLARDREQIVESLIELGNQVDGLEVPVGTGREARLDHVHLQPLELAGDAQLLVLGHRGAGRLLAVAQGGVEDDEFVCHGISFRLDQLGTGLETSAQVTRARCSPETMALSDAETIFESMPTPNNVRSPTRNSR